MAPKSKLRTNFSPRAVAAARSRSSAVSPRRQRRRFVHRKGPGASTGTEKRGEAENIVQGDSIPAAWASTGRRQPERRPSRAAKESARASDEAASAKFFNNCGIIIGERLGEHQMKGEGEEVAASVSK